MFEIHPAAELFPLMSDDEFAALKKNISEQGLLEPIWIYDGRILDGRNRYRACNELGIDPSTREYTGASPVAFVWSLNAERRHLTKSQRATIGVEMLPLLEAEAQKRIEATQLAGRDQEGHAISAGPISASPKDETGKSADLAGKQVGVGRTMIQKAKQVQTEDAELFQQVKRGEVQLEDAHRKVKEGRPIPAMPRTAPKEERARQIRELAADGNRAAQISEKIGIGEQQIRKIAREEGITLPDAAIGKVQNINAHSLIENTVHGLEGFALGLKMINGAVRHVDSATATQWSESLKTSLIPIHRLQKQLREVANGN